MMALLTELGCDTGYTQRKARQVMTNDFGAFEYMRDFRKGIARDDATDVDFTPRIIKHPSDESINRILPMARNREWQVEHVLITYRDFVPLIKSTVARWRKRRMVSDEEEIFKHKDKAEVLYPFTFGLIVNDVLVNHYSHNFIEFPRLVVEPSYCYNCMLMFLEGIEYKDFLIAHKRFADPSKVHFI